MSGLFSSKTKSTSTSSTKVPQNFQNFLNMSLDKASAAGSQGFTQYNAPRIAELSANEQAGTQAAAMNAGMYQPLIDAAGQATVNNLASNGAPTQPELDQFINPYVNYVLGNSLNRLQETSDANMTKIGSTAAMSGAFGGLRHGVLEGANLAELLKSARDLSGSTYADAFDKGMGNWFKSKDLQRGNISDALNVARQGQAYNTGDIQNLMSTGLTGRTRDQALLDFGYSEFMREDQDDINKASFLSSIAAQYPRDLFTKTNVTETTQTDSPIKTLAGIGLAAAGIMSGNPAAIAGLGAGSSALGSGYGPAANAAYNVLTGDGKNAKGGLIKTKKYADGGMVKAGLAMAAGEDPLSAFAYMDPEDVNKHDLGFGAGGAIVANNTRWNDFATNGLGFDDLSDAEKLQKFGSKGTRFIQDYRDAKGLTRKAAPLEIAQKQPFNWDAFIQNMRLNTTGQQGGSPLDAFSQINPNFLKPRTQTFAPQTPNVNVTPLNPGIPGPGGPMGLNGNALNRFAGGGFVSDQRKDAAKSVSQLDPQTLDILGQMLQKHEFGNSKDALRSYNQPNLSQFGNSNDARRAYDAPPPMPDWMQDPDMIRMMQDVFKSKRVPQFDSFQDVIDGKQSGYAGGGHIGPGNRPGFPSVEPDESNWLAILGLQSMFESEPPTSFESNTTDADLDRAEQLARRSVDEIRRSTPFAAKRMRNENADLRNKINANTNLDRPRSPLDEMVERLTKRTMIPREAPMLNEIRGDDTQREPPIFDERWRDYEKFLNNIDPSKPLQGEYKKFTPTKKRAPIEFEPIEDGRIGREMEERARKMILENAKKKKYPDIYAAGGAVKRFQEGNFVEGGSSFKGKGKSRARVPAEGIDPLAAIYYGMNSNNGTFKPDFENIGRDDVLTEVANESFGEGTITKAQARSQGGVPSFNSPQDVIDSLPIDPNVEEHTFTPTPMPAYSKSRMWNGVNEDVFMDGTFMNEQDNKIKDKNLSLNKDSLAFGQHQYLPSTWNTYAKRFMKENPELAKELGVFTVKESDLAKFRGKSGDKGIAKVIPSFKARDYVYRNYYLPDSVQALEKAGLPVTELNLYLAHHLGQEGATKAIPLMENPKYAKRSMKQVLLDAGLTTAANSKGNPWGMSVNEYKQKKNAAYEPYKAKYRGETIDETLAKGFFNELNSEPVAFNDADYIDIDARRQSMKSKTYRDIQRALLAPGSHRGVDARTITGEYTRGGKGFSNGGYVKKFAGGGHTGPKQENVLRMPADPKDQKIYEPTWYEKFLERMHSPDGPFGSADDVLYDNGLNFYPSNSGKRPTHQAVLPIDEKGWDYKPNPNLYMDALGEWGPNEDPVDAFYKEMGDKIGYPTGEQQIEEAPDSGRTTGAPGAPSGYTESDNPLEREYNKMLEEYLAYKKPEKGKVFGLFSDVNEPLLKLGLSLLASKGSFGEALGEAGLASLKDREIEQFKDQKEKSDKLQEILNIRYKQAQMEAMDPSNKLALAQAQAGFKETIQQMKIDNALEMLNIRGASANEKIILEGLMNEIKDNGIETLSPEKIEWLQERGVPVTPVQDPGTSL